MRRAAKVDANQAEIVGVLRAHGFTVYPAHAVGGGFPDLVVGWGKQTFLVEVKDGAKPPSKQALTPAQQDFARDWKGNFRVINSIDAALEWVREVKRPETVVMHRNGPDRNRTKQE